MSEQIYDQLKSLGYATVPKVIDQAQCGHLVEILKKINNSRNSASIATHDKSTIEERRFIEATGQILLRDCLLDRPENFLPFINLELVMSLLNHLFGELPVLDGFSASTTYKRDPMYSHPPKVHIDSRLAIPQIENSTHLGVMICLDEFNQDNGGIKLWPGSHTSGLVVHKEPSFRDAEPPGAHHVYMPAGSIIFFLGQTWHQIGTSQTEQSRWALLLTYTRWWIKPQTDYTLCGSAIFDICNAEQKSLLGFTSMPSHNRFIRSKTLTDPSAIPDKYDEVSKLRSCAQPSSRPSE